MWRRRSRGRQPNSSDAEIDLVRECELFLAGRYAEHLRAVEKPLPGWVWLNPLAHGSGDELIRLRDKAGERKARSDWTTAVGFLAGEILAFVDDDPDDLRVVQQEALVPLELHLASNWFSPVTPTQLVRRVSAELDRCDRRHRPQTGP
jgi:hypothetical protein